MTERKIFEIRELKKQILIDCNYHCEVCEKAINEYNAQLAHIIPKTKYNLKKYSSEIIHHRLNMKAVCCLACNSSVLIGNNIETEKEIVDKIKSM